ncbi:serine hydrolase [Nonomuraea sp. NPDC050536]|uniref:serine hydrolase n=1 Tax=Nonomuraea sp. NPDC050536 TaxID=3364366 RepID=UPI0037C84AF0
MTAISEPQPAPGGRIAAYVADLGEYRTAIWLIDTGTGERRPLTAGPDDTDPCWSPDGSRVAFLREGRLHVVPAAGGLAQPLAALAGDLVPLDWSPDGEWVAVLAGEDGTDEQHLFLMPASGGPVRQLTAGGFRVHSAAWSPGGDELVYSVAGQAFAVPASGGPPYGRGPDGTLTRRWVWHGKRRGPLLVDVHDGPRDPVPRPYQRALLAAGWTVLLVGSGEPDVRSAVDALVEEEPGTVFVHGRAPGYPGAARFTPGKDAPRLEEWARRRARPLPGLTSYLRHLTAQYGVPGVSVGVLHDDEITTYVAGVANLDTGIEVTDDTVFQIGSNTKLLTAELIMQLAGEGRLELDEPVTRHLPEFRLRDADAGTVTIRHLLCHRGGFLGDFPGEGDLGWGEDNLARYVAQLAGVAQLHPVGELWSYSNSGMVVLGHVVEHLTGLPYDRAVRERIAEPIGAASILFRPEEIIKRRAAVGHVPDPDTGRIGVARHYLEQPWCAPSGSITVSTAEDVLRFVRHHLGDPERAALMHEQQVAIPPMAGTHGWGLGWALRTLTDGRAAVGHGGATIGQLSALDVVPEAGVAVVVLTNAPGGAALGQRVTDHVLRELTGAAVADPVTRPGEPPRLDLTRYAGRYDGVLHTLEVTADGDGLAATLQTDLSEDPPPPPRPLRLIPVSERTFTVSGTTQYVHFLEPGQDGRPAYASVLGRILPRSAR